MERERRGKKGEEKRGVQIAESVRVYGARGERDCEIDVVVKEEEGRGLKDGGKKGR